MSAQDEFLQLVKDGLNHLYDYSYLDSHPLALRYRPEITQERSRAQFLHRLLLEGIEELHPPTEHSRDTPRARAYSLLVCRYVEEWPLPDIMRELRCSRRQIFREQKKALTMLAVYLWEKLPPETSAPTTPDDLLASEAERVLAEQESVDLREVIQGVMETIGPLADRQGVALKHDPSQPLPLTQGSRTLLRQVFLKLLSSLVIQPGAKQIDISLNHTGDRVIAELTTKGDVPTEQANRTGVNLESLHRLVRLAGGEWNESPARAEGPKYCISLRAINERVLLVVEDNDAVIRAFHRYLVGYNYQVIGATSGAEALRFAREISPAAITLDVMMPSKDGWEILQILKNDPSTLGIPVIICSVLEDPELAYSLGAASYLRKPITQTDLLAALESLPILQQET